MLTVPAPEGHNLTENVLPDLARWRHVGLRTALVTLVGIDGRTPRPLGAQMAVAADGRWSGYLSGGCLEEAVAAEARRAMDDGQNRLVRYGKGSPYFDIKLPCGSGLDLYFDISMADAVVREALSLRHGRTPFAMETDLGTGASIIRVPGGEEPLPTVRDGQRFSRGFNPDLRVLVTGGGPATAAIAALIAAAGLEVSVATPDSAVAAELSRYGLSSSTLGDSAVLESVDRFTAAVVAFHEHEREAPVLVHLLRSKAFFIGVMGSHTAHMSRVAALEAMGLRPPELARLTAPVGLIPAAKSRRTLAAGILAHIMLEARSQGLLD